MVVGEPERSGWGWDEPVTEATLELPRRDEDVTTPPEADSGARARVRSVADRLPRPPSLPRLPSLPVSRGSADAVVLRLRALGSAFLDSRRAQLALAGALALLLVVLVSTGGGESQATHPKRPARPPAAAKHEPPVPQAAALPLREGDRGHAVRVLQQALASLGYAVGKPDGFFGDRTKHAVELFQTASQVSADGIVGQRTVRMLKIALAKAGSDSS
jgi:hypothetical protein